MCIYPYVCERVYYTHAVHIYISVCVSALHTHTHVHIYVHVHMFTCNTYISESMPIAQFSLRCLDKEEWKEHSLFINRKEEVSTGRMHTCTHTHTHTYKHTHTHTYIHTYTHTHTHIHTYTYTLMYVDIILTYTYVYVYVYIWHRVFLVFWLYPDSLRIGHHSC